jgi:anti-sigma regulatory factor (Ser/Thr protein kinase)
MVKTLVVPGNLDSLSDIGAFVLQETHASGIPKKAAYKLRLAVDEIATNIILHGYTPSGIQADLYLYAMTDALALYIALMDFAPPFDPYSIKPPTNMDMALDERDEGGLGIWLALNQIDGVRYHYVDRHNINILQINRPLLLERSSL